MNDVRPLALALLGTQRHCVLSTVGPDGEPQSAFVAFSEADDCSVVFGTFDDSRKFANVVRDPRVSIVVADDEREVQLEGTARVTEGEDALACRKRHASKNPSTERYADDPRQRYLLVTPTWLRYVDYAGDDEVVLESRF